METPVPVMVWTDLSLVMLRKKHHQLLKHVALAQQYAVGYQKTIADLEVQLTEARRRTIPIGPNGQNGELNFMPLYIEKVEMTARLHEITSAHGREVVSGRAEAVIHAVGDVLYNTPIAKEKVR